MMKKNCWEHKTCGRQPGGSNTEEFGVCPVATYDKAHGINNGINGGRACWVIEGTLCEGKIQGTFSQKMGKCMKCEFYNQVRQEEGQDYKGTKEIVKQLNGSLKTTQHAGLNTDSPFRTFASSGKNSNY